jgi:hypothetical protein
MRSSGKVSVTLIIVAAFVVGIVFMALATGESPTIASARFMNALAQGEAETLTDLSYAPGVPREEMLEQWKFATDVVAPYYVFTYEITDEARPTKGTAIVSMMVTKNAASGSAYPERFELQLYDTDDGWKVDVFSISRDMYPGLPR